MVKTRVGASLLAVALVVTTSMNTQPAVAASATEINRDVDAALAKLYADIPDARTLAEKARGVLVFPNVVKAGFLLGAQYGDGALRRQGRTVAYYNTVAASYGLQAGVQSFGYVLFFMTEPALEYLDKSDGFELGVGQHRRPGRREGQDHDDHDDAERNLCVHLRSAGPDGRHGPARLEDQPDRPLIAHRPSQEPPVTTESPITKPDPLSQSNA